MSVCTTNHDSSLTSLPSSVFINSCSYLSLPTRIVINHCWLRYRNWTLDGRCWQTWKKPRKMQRPYLRPLQQQRLPATTTEAHKSSALCSLWLKSDPSPILPLPQFFISQCVSPSQEGLLRDPFKNGPALSPVSGMCLYQWWTAAL